ncbi:MAG TPA: hypothetical protein VFJ96_10590 [Gemmatimonadaceae bacterium]|jgi:hypothetical protein|nr:hypothetical protein [Gemmatimonadaceae bacterium]
MVNIPGELIPIVLFVMMGVTAIGVPIARAFARRMDRQSLQPRVPTELAERLEHMEHAIDAIAIEVERISEGQRFTTKLLSERNRDGAALPASSERGA